MNIHIYQNQDFLPISIASAENMVREFIVFAGLHYDEVSVYFVDIEEITELHGQYFDDPTPTDCISFPMEDDEDETYRVMGDVFICPEVANLYVKEHGGNVYEETSRYVIHSLLHLIGYDDIEEEANEEMRKQENRFLSHMIEKQYLLTP